MTTKSEKTIMKNYKLISQITMWVLLALGVVVVAMFFLGGSAGSLEVAGDYLDIPKFSDLFLTWVYILLAIVVLVTLFFVCVGQVNLFKTDKKKAIRTLCVIVGFIVLCAACWFLGSPEKIDIIGYEGTDNQGTWAQLSDAVIYMCYALVAGTLVTMCWGLVHTKTLK